MWCAAVAAVVLAVACSKRGGAREQSGQPAPSPQIVVQAPARPAPAAAKPDEGFGGANAAAWFRANYTKYEFRIPMRDGTRLFTAVTVPNDASPAKRYPFVLNRTPYSIKPYGADRYPPIAPEPWVKEGYIFVSQDVRGRFMSEGTYADVRPIRENKKPTDVDESTDTYDTVAWLLANIEHHNGKVAIWGQSYPGFYTTSGIIDGHPAIVAAVPMAPIADWWIGDDMHRNGAVTIQIVFAFFSRFGIPRPEPIADEHAWPPFDYGTPDAYQFFMDLGALSELDASDWKNEIPFWNDIKAHPDYDEFWQARNILPRLKNIRAAVWTVAGWYDTEDFYGSIETYKAIEKQNPSTKNTIIVGPWVHGGWWQTGDKLGDADFGFPTSAPFLDRVNAYLKHHLKGGPDPGHPDAEVFETGANRWRRFDAWPPKAVKPATFWLREDGGLGRDAPTAGDGFDEYVSDPARPVPYTQDPQTGDWSDSYVAEDQRFASRRPDVLVYQSPVLDDDLTIAGPIDVELYVSTTGTDADWVVKVVDVWPGKPSWQGVSDLESRNFGNAGKQILVRGEPFRGRYRDSLETPSAFVPGQIAKVSFRLDDVFHTFLRGHRVMVQVQSSWFPFIDRNPQTFVPSIYEAKRSDFVKATHRVHRAAGAASKIDVLILPRKDEVVR
jgi:putative CocE/NonD family hydrolase